MNGPLKEKELRALATCNRCHRKVGQWNLPIFWKVTLERHVVDVRAVQRQQGLGLLLGSGALAAVMGPNDNMTAVIADEITITICDDCALENGLAGIAEVFAARKEEEGGK